MEHYWPDSNSDHYSPDWDCDYQEEQGSEDFERSIDLKCEEEPDPLQIQIDPIVFLDPLPFQPQDLFKPE